MCGKIETYFGVELKHTRSGSKVPNAFGEPHARQIRLEQIGADCSGDRMQDWFAATRVVRGHGLGNKSEVEGH